jgi:hypothetical protein
MVKLNGFYKLVSLLNNNVNSNSKKEPALASQILLIFKQYSELSFSLKVLNSGVCGELSNSNNNNNTNKMDETYRFSDHQNQQNRRRTSSTSSGSNYSSNMMTRSNTGMNPLKLALNNNYSNNYAYNTSSQTFLHMQNRRFSNVKLNSSYSSNFMRNSNRNSEESIAFKGINLAFNAVQELLKFY